MQNSFQFQLPDQGLCLWTLLGLCGLTPRYGFTPGAHHVAPETVNLDPPVFTPWFHSL